MQPILLILVSLTAPGVSADWPQFRGPTAVGHADCSELPTHFSDSKNVTWKAPIPGKGWSSPVIRGGQVWMTTALREGKSLRAVCVDRESGKIIHDVEVFTPEEPVEVHGTNSHASPTPVLEEGRVYVHFGSMGTACLSTKDGRVLWRHNSTRVDHMTGPGTSPIIAGSRLIIPFDGADAQFVLAFDKESGAIDWKRERSAPLRDNLDGRRSFCTPLLIRVDGVEQIISPGADQVHAYDPATGAEIWQLRYRGFSVVPRPVFGHGLLYLATGFFPSEFLAIRPGGRGDVTATHVVWRRGRQAPTKVSPILVDDLIYTVSDKGIASCLVARSGEEVWRERLGDTFSASPVYAAGHMYFPTESGKILVIKPSRKLEIVATNEFPGTFMASPAVAGNALFLRSDTHLYRIETRA